ncbi:hypothetical protein EJ08DRAFT_737085 [Tothia fuscella]|uniref:Uncharacterized protein n=1 Tax=Tothia fuscella TaxID=1048955 RepID=A0A9P4TUC8_9PEZI|nr:hypothetical protein EJ08DRAFT_737085 [Tothia fuscella]
MMPQSSAVFAATVSFFLSLHGALAESAPEGKPWSNGDLIPITCLNRTIDTGEHITDSHGNLQYIPFPTCAETNTPLALLYSQSKTQNCTINLTDPLFHLLEFYIHNDAPLTCRIPSLPSSISTKDLSGQDKAGVMGSESVAYTPLVMALSGTLQLSHLHVANELNLLIHTSTDPPTTTSTKDTPPKSKAAKGKIDSASAYSISPTTRNTKIIIGDNLTLTFHIRWYPSSFLPLTSSHHGFWSTLSYCIFAAGASAAICIAYFRGVELPRRLKFHGRDAMNGGLPKYNGYGYFPGGGASPGVGNGYGGYGFPGTGKRD